MRCSCEDSRCFLTSERDTDVTLLSVTRCRAGFFPRFASRTDDSASRHTTDAQNVTTGFPRLSTS
eukprot:scaffold446469_cov53-Prasinocladus_malaysianus.AAC.1